MISIINIVLYIYILSISLLCVLVVVVVVVEVQLVHVFNMNDWIYIYKRVFIAKHKNQFQDPYISDYNDKSCPLIFALSL